MGKQYYEQLSGTAYCRIKYIADRRWKEYENPPVPIKDPECIKEENNIKIVITTDRYADDVKKWLIEAGVSEENIIAANIELNAYSKESIFLSKDEWNYLNEFRSLVSIMDVVSPAELIRVGRDNDGGYLMLDSFDKTGGVAYSFGISNDVSWDKDMAGKGYDVFMYDHTINSLPEENDRFHWKKIGLASGNTNSSELRTLEDLINENGHISNENMILKMDVEGAEWGCFDNADPGAIKRFDQIVLEIHGILTFDQKDLIIRVLKKINETHQCIHVHMNNYSRVVELEGIPFADCLELSFVNRSRYSFAKCDHLLPHTLDQSCDPEVPEIVLRDFYNI